MAAAATLLPARAVGLEISPDYLIKNKAVITFLVESTSAGSEIVPGAVDALQAAQLSPRVTFVLLLPDSISYMEPVYSHDSSVQISADAARKISVATCGLFNNLPREDAPLGDEDDRIPPPFSQARDPALPKEHFRVSIHVRVGGLQLEYDTRFIPKTTKLPKDFLSLLESVQPYSPHWAKQLK